MNEDSLVAELAQIISNVTDFDGARLDSHFAESELRMVAKAVVPTVEGWYRQGKDDGFEEGYQQARVDIAEWLRAESESHAQSRDMDIRNEGWVYGNIAQVLEAGEWIALAARLE